MPDGVVMYPAGSAGIANNGSAGWRRRHIHDLAGDELVGDEAISAFQAHGVRVEFRGDTIWCVTILNGIGNPTYGRRAGCRRDERLCRLYGGQCDQWFLSRRECICGGNRRRGIDQILCGRWRFFGDETHQRYGKSPDHQSDGK